LNSFVDRDGDNASETISAGERYEFPDGEKDVKNSRLVIKSVQMNDRGYYFCDATNEVMTELGQVVTEKAYFRVKDKLAALWPFLGICAEVFVLCAIILIYEKRRNKTEMEESDTDQSPDQ